MFYLNGIPDEYFLKTHMCNTELMNYEILIKEINLIQGVQSFFNI